VTPAFLECPGRLFPLVVAGARHKPLLKLRIKADRVLTSRVGGLVLLDFLGEAIERGFQILGIVQCV